jgi:hypothetical protein
MAPMLPPQGMPPQGMPPQGMPPQGMPPQGMPPQGMPHGQAFDPRFARPQFESSAPVPGYADYRSSGASAAGPTAAANMPDLSFLNTDFLQDVYARITNGGNVAK